MDLKVYSPWSCPTLPHALDIRSTCKCFMAYHEDLNTWTRPELMCQLGLELESYCLSIRILWEWLTKLQVKTDHFHENPKHLKSVSDCQEILQILAKVLDLESKEVWAIILAELPDGPGRFLGQLLCELRR